MNFYYVNIEEQANGGHEVHRSTCNDMPLYSKLIYLGHFDDSDEAITEAKKYFQQSKGCPFCCSKATHPAAPEKR